MLKVRAIRACTRRFRYRVPLARRGGQEPPQAMEFLPWDALGPPGRGVPGGQALRYGTHAPAKCAELNVPWNLRRIRSTPLRSSGCSRAAMPRSVGKSLADRDGVWLCVYWCSIERASVREFMSESAAEKLWFYGYAQAHPKVA